MVDEIPKLLLFLIGKIRCIGRKENEISLPLERHLSCEKGFQNLRLGTNDGIESMTMSRLGGWCR